jgi:Bacterial SH3 domain
MLKGVIMTKMMVIIALGFATNTAYADLASDLRSLNNTVTEMSRTGKELGAIGNQPTTQQTQSQSSQVNPKADGELKSGDMLRSKISKVKVFKEPSKKSDKAGMLSKSDEMIYMGEEANGFYKVTATNGEGWVEKLLVQKTN